MSQGMRNVFVVKNEPPNNKYPPVQDQVLDLRKSTSSGESPKGFSTHPVVHTLNHPLCIWCDKPCIPGETSFDEAFCSDVCFNQYRRQSFKKRSLCMWCSGFSPGPFDSPLDETKFCSHQCLTQYKLKLFCDETSAHLGHMSEGNHEGSFLVSQESHGTPEQNDLITPELWLSKLPRHSQVIGKDDRGVERSSHVRASDLRKSSSSSSTPERGSLKRDGTRRKISFISKHLRRNPELKRGKPGVKELRPPEDPKARPGGNEEIDQLSPVQPGGSRTSESVGGRNGGKGESGGAGGPPKTFLFRQNDLVDSTSSPLAQPEEERKKETQAFHLFPTVPPVTVLVPFAIPFPIPIPIPIFIHKPLDSVLEGEKKGENQC